MNQPLLHIKDLRVSFNGESQEAVKGISLQVQPGEIVAVVGESGSGKSVSALSILQLLPNTATIRGEVLFQNQNLLQLKANEMRQIRGKDIAMIFQEPMTSLNPVFTCGHQVQEAIQQHIHITKQEAKKKVIDLFAKVHLPDPEKIYKRYPHEISGGQKQRVMIAMAISCNPSLLIADEPTTALDVTVQKNILQLLGDIQQQNQMSVVFITHDLGLVADVADKVVVMYRGEIVEQGACRDVLNNPQHAYTKALLACRPAANTKGKRLAVVSDFLQKTGQPSGLETIRMPSIDVDTCMLEVKNLSVHYPLPSGFWARKKEFFKAVDQVSFHVSKGETVGLVGESGCGKTTLGRTILQLIKPSAGSIYLQGEDITQFSGHQLRRARKDFQIVFQDPYGSLNPRLTVGNAILEALKVHRIKSNVPERKEWIAEMLEKVSMPVDSAKRYPHQFSGGQRQRICIARALALNPAFLVFDESVSALDVSVQAQVLNLINDLKAEFGFTSLFISHDLSVVHYICDRVLVMQKGRIVESGPADEIYFRPTHAYTRELIASVPGKNLVWH